MHITSSKRFKRGDIYGLVVKTGARSAIEVQAIAQSNSDKGDHRLAEFCTSCTEDKLAELVRSAVAVIEAPQQLALKSSTRMDRLRRAAADAECCCNGVWMHGAQSVLVHQGENVPAFCRDVCRALELGACRGVNIAIIGEPGCGKSMLFEPFDRIFKVIQVHGMRWGVHPRWRGRAPLHTLRPGRVPRPAPATHCPPARLPAAGPTPPTPSNPSASRALRR